MASFQFQQGIADDSFSRLIIGNPFKKSALGISVGYYNGGNLELFDGDTTRSVTAKRDLLLSLGGASKWLLPDLITFSATFPRFHI